MPSGCAWKYKRLLLLVEFKGIGTLIQKKSRKGSNPLTNRAPKIIETSYRKFYRSPIVVSFLENKGPTKQKKGSHTPKGTNPPNMSSPQKGKPHRAPPPFDPNVSSAELLATADSAVSRPSSAPGFDGSPAACGWGPQVGWLGLPGLRTPYMTKYVQRNRYPGGKIIQIQFSKWIDSPKHQHGIPLNIGGGRGTSIFLELVPCWGVPKMVPLSWGGLKGKQGTPPFCSPPFFRNSRCHRVFVKISDPKQLALVPS